MAKSRGQEGDKDLPDEQQPHDGNGEDRRKTGGRTIARWKVQAHQELPQGSDEEIAACINRVAQEENYDYVCSATQVAKWRENDTWPPAPAPESAPPERAAPMRRADGYALDALRELIHLLGKEGVKKLIDSL